MYDWPRCCRVNEIRIEVIDSLMKKVERPLKQVNQINLTQFIEFSSLIIKTELIFCELQL